MRQHNMWCVYVRSVWRGMPDWTAPSPAYPSKQYDGLSQPVVPYTHTAGSKLRCQTPTKHTKNICEPLRVISFKHSSLLPDDGSHTIRNMLE